jgi:hypothetical protein
MCNGGAYTWQLVSFLSLLDGLFCCCACQEISKIVGEMWQRTTPEEKAPFVEEVNAPARLLPFCFTVVQEH